MERYLVITGTQKSFAALTRLLHSCGIMGTILQASSGAEARRILTESSFRLIIVNTPLPDEFGHEVAQTAARTTIAGILLLVKSEVAETMIETVQENGVCVVSKPLSHTLLIQALHMARATHARLVGLQDENRRLQKRIEEIRLIDRAKCLLIECCAMSEPEAHTYMERQAMTRRLPKIKIAEQILRGELLSE